MKYIRLAVILCGLQACATPIKAFEQQLRVPPTPTTPPKSDNRLVEDIRVLLRSGDDVRRAEGLEQAEALGEAAAPLIDDLSPLLSDPEGPCLDVIRILSSIGPKAARAIPSLVKVLDWNLKYKKDGRIANPCPLLVENAVSKFGDAAFPYIYNVRSAERLLGSLTFGRATELLARIRNGGPYIEASTMAMAEMEQTTVGFREALIAGHENGVVNDRLFLKALGGLQWGRELAHKETVPRRSVEPIVRKIAESSKDAATRTEAARLLPLFECTMSDGSCVDQFRQRKEITMPKSAPRATPKEGPKSTPGPTPTPVLLKRGTTEMESEASNRA